MCRRSPYGLAHQLYYLSSGVGSISALKIVFCDEHWLVIDKPAGLLVHPGADKSQPHLIELLPADIVASSERLVLQHRLDKETSGLVLLTRTQAECVRVAQLFADRKVQKTYLCRSALYPQRRSQKSWTVDLALGQRKGRVWIDPQGQNALTRFRHLGQGWIEAKPHTGRKHQIRVHLAQAGWPIDGDQLYRGRPFHRMMLHAWKLQLEHPLQGSMELCSELAAEFRLSV